MLRAVDWQREDGRWFKVLLPDDVPDTEAEMGIVVGPPEFDQIGFVSEEARKRFGNELFHRGVITFQDALLRRKEIEGAIKIALALDIETVMVVYRDELNGSPSV